MQGQAPKSAITGVPGWETEAEQDYLVRLAASVPEDGAIVEIGGEFGQSASLFAHGADKTVSITTVDLFPGELVDAHIGNLSEAGFEGRTVQIKGDSKTVGKAWDTEIDLLFVDGDHSYNGAKADLQIWSPLVKPLGALVVHDCVTPDNTTPHALHFEVNRAVDEWYAANTKQFKEEGTVGTMRTFTRLDLVSTGAEPSAAKPAATKAPAKPAHKTPAKKKAAAK